ncbi:MAG: Na/Pi cotransporter family protein [Saprospirales bacterium]|nr:MAG: Na/Pi cotransporter family protein [Saprospirales bacterium]
MENTLVEKTNILKGKPKWIKWLAIVVLVYLLLLAVGVISRGFNLATAEHAKVLFDFASNPVIALIIGIVATASIQSSSTVTSIIVGMVAGGMPMAIAIPMVMGANIGTSLTSTIVSLGHIQNRAEFRRAFSAATVHDCFNLLAVLIILPIEMLFQPLEILAGHFAAYFRSGASVDIAVFNPIDASLQPLLGLITTVFSFLPDIWDGVFMILFGIAMILFVIKEMGRILKKLMVGRSLELMQKTVGRGPISGIFAGGMITVMVQSSSTTTALIVPMAGNGVFSIKQVYPFTLGGNIGTTITALVASMAFTGPMAVLAFQIAMVHFFFNLFGILLIYSLPFLRNLPVIVSEKLADISMKNRFFVMAYILGVFFAAPLIIIGIARYF